MKKFYSVLLLILMVSCKQSTNPSKNTVIQDSEVTPFVSTACHMDTPNELYDFLTKEGYKVYDEIDIKSLFDVKELIFWKGLTSDGKIASTTSCYEFKNTSLPTLKLAVWDEDVYEQLLTRLFKYGNFIYIKNYNDDFRDWFYYLGSLFNGSISIDLLVGENGYNLYYRRVDNDIVHEMISYMDLATLHREASNAVSFLNKYRNRYLKITGKLSSIRNYSLGPSITLIEEDIVNIDYTINPLFKKYLNDIKSGDIVNICGYLTDCRTGSDMTMKSVIIMPKNGDPSAVEDIKEILDEAKVKKSQLKYEKMLKEAGRTDEFILAKDSEPSNFYGRWKIDSTVPGVICEVLITPDYAKYTDEPNVNINNLRREEWESRFGKLYIFYRDITEASFEIDETYTRMRMKKYDGTVVYYHKVN